jgi:hypothetical protein
MNGQLKEKTSHTDRKTYETPRIKTMTEEEVLSAFQITQAGVTWWVM